MIQRIVFLSLEGEQSSASDDCNESIRSSNHSFLYDDDDEDELGGNDLGIEFVPDAQNCTAPEKSLTL